MNGDFQGYSGRTVTYNINNDLTSGKGTMADLECFNVYFRKVLKVAVPILTFLVSLKEVPKKAFYSQLQIVLGVENQDSLQL